MAQLRLKVVNVNTNKVMYSGVKATGDFDDLYNCLRRSLNDILDHRGTREVYDDAYYAFGRRRGSNRNKPKQAYGTPYVSVKDGAYRYTYTLVL